jgi:hypothetical protein
MSSLSRPCRRQENKFGDTHTYTHMQEDKFGDIQTVKTKSGKSRKGRYMGGGGAFEKERNPLQNFDSDW